MGTGYIQQIQPLATTRYRVIVTGAAASAATSEPVEVTVQDDDPLCTGGLLVSSFDNDRILRYSFRSRLPQLLVPTGGGGLNGPSKLICGPDGNVYVASYNNDKVLRYDGGNGAFLGELPADLLDGPAWLAVGCQAAVTAVTEPVVNVLDVHLEPNVPNPFDPRTSIAFTLTGGGRARVAAFDLAGRLVSTLLDRELSAGRHTVEWNGRGSDGRAVASGVYFLCVESGRVRTGEKMLLLR